MSLATTVKRRLRRSIRYRGVVERAQFELRRSPDLVLPAPVGLHLTIREGDVILDCGANVGDITSLFARSGATVYAFEPNPRCFRILRRRFAWMPTVRCIGKGVMDRPCVLTLSCPVPHAGFDAIDVTVASSVIPGAMHDGEYAVETTSAECVDLNEFILALGRRVRLLKLDIEGAEIEVLTKLLDAGTIDLVDLTVVETHEAQVPSLRDRTEALRARVDRMGLSEKIRLDWA